MTEEAWPASASGPRWGGRWTLRLASFGLGALLLTACMPALPWVARTPQELAVGALNALVGKPVVHVTGSLFKDKAYQVDVTGSQDGPSSGSGTFAGQPFEYLGVSGKQYLKGATLWQSLYQDPALQRRARGYRDSWVVAGDTPVAAVLAQVVSPYALVPTLGSHVKQLKRGETSSVGGRSVVALEDGRITYYVTDSDPMRLVRVQSQPGFAEAQTGLSRLDLQISYPGGAPSVEAPQPSIDPADPRTMPALYTVVTEADDTPCNQTSCVFKITLHDQAGKPEGQTIVTLHVLSDPDRKEVGSCQAAAPAADYGQDVTTTCTISGAGWTAWWQSNVKTGHNTYIATYDFKNPPYDG